METTLFWLKLLGWVLGALLILTIALDLLRAKRSRSNH